MLLWIGLATTAVAWLTWHTADRRWLAATGVGVLLLAASGATAYLTVTPAEHGELVVRWLVDAAVAADAAAMKSTIAPAATWHRGSADAPAEDAARIDRAFDRVCSSERISSNTVTVLDGRTTSETTATVDLACFTSTRNSQGLMSSRWEFQVARAPDGSWLITQIVWVRFLGEVPGRGLL